MFFKSKNAKPPAAVADPTSVPTLPAMSTAAGAASSASSSPTSAGGTSSASPIQSPASKGAQQGQANARTGRLMLLLGQIVTILMRSAPYKTLPIGDLETMVLPAIAAGQFVIANAQVKTGGATIPIAAALWARVSPEIDRRLTETNGQSRLLKPADWSSGDIVWLLLLAGEANSVNALFARLQQHSQLRGRPIKYITDVEGKFGVHTLQPSAASA